MSRSNGHQVHLWKVNWFTKGLYRCEVTADDFETASSSVETEVVGRFQGSLHHASSCPLTRQLFDLKMNKPWICSSCSDTGPADWGTENSLLCWRLGTAELLVQCFLARDRTVLVCQLKRGTVQKKPELFKSIIYTEITKSTSNKQNFVLLENSCLAITNKKGLAATKPF